MINRLALLGILFCQASLQHQLSTDSPNYLVDDTALRPDEKHECVSRRSMPLVKLGSKFYYIGTFFKTNWYKAFQYCRFHGLHLATVDSAEENELLNKHLLDSGLLEHFWLSGTDYGSGGKFFWMSTGKPIRNADWWPGQPDNYKGANDEYEHCLCYWNPHGTGLKFNDCLCSSSLYFICELEQ